MSARDPKTGRFVSRPVLHRQVVDIDLSGITGDHIHGAEFECVPISQPTKPKPDPHGPRIELTVVWIIVIAVAIGLALVAHLLGAWG